MPYTSEWNSQHIILYCMHLGFCAATADRPRNLCSGVETLRQSLQFYWNARVYWFPRHCKKLAVLSHQNLTTQSFLFPMHCTRIKIWPDCQLIYRHYATLYFIFVADKSESELGILDLIQGFICADTFDDTHFAFELIGSYNHVTPHSFCRSIEPRIPWCLRTGSDF